MDLDSSFSAYFRRREAEERELAAKAVNPAIRDIHLTMADQYRKKTQEAARLENEVPGRGQ